MLQYLRSYKYNLYINKPMINTIGNVYKTNIILNKDKNLGIYCLYSPKNIIATAKIRNNYVAI